MDDDHPPVLTSFVNSIELSSLNDSKIDSVSVYTGRAEVTRIFKILVKTGQNKIAINELSGALDMDSIRVEGSGPIVIHDVSVRRMPELPTRPTVSPALNDLMHRKDRTERALERCKRMHDGLEKYLSTLHIERIAVSELDGIVEGYDTAAEKLDEKVLNLEAELRHIEEEIKNDQDNVSALVHSRQRNGLENIMPTAVIIKPTRALRTQVSLNIFADTENEIRLVLGYAVNNANWDAVYDIRVNTQVKENPVTLIYKAAITQNTGEDWQDVTLTLETATPSFAIGLPTLDPWTLSVAGRGPRVIETARRVSRFSASSIPRSRSIEERSRSPSPLYRSTTVSSKGNISATFSVPGTTTVPSDGATHNVAVSQLKLGATISWLSIPKLDAKTHMSAKIKNASEYTLLRGVGYIYVDGSFISKATVPAVSPEECFDCLLGLDPAVRITYHPATKKQTRTGFYNKSKVQSYSQRISVHNTKSIPVNLQIVDQIPVAQDDEINVKLITPALPSVPLNVGSLKEDKKASTAADQGKRRLEISPGIVAQWGDGTEDMSDDGMTIVGQDGKLSWICEVPSQGKINLLLQWEVVTPTRTVVSGS